MKSLILNHLYSKSLNIYGDLGNIIALRYLAQQYNIRLDVVSTEIGDKFIPADIYFIGGGQDKDQLVVYPDLLKHKQEIESEISRGKVFLLVCGGYQLFGKSFVDGNGNQIEGLGILDMETRAPDNVVSSRCIGDEIVQMSSEFIQYWRMNTKFSHYLVGFENHGGQSRFGSSTSSSSRIRPIGNVVHGFGNNSTEKIEGAWHKNAIGCYLHGSLLPKNPHLGVAIIAKALGQQIGILDTSLEKKAHQEILKRYGINVA